MPGPVDHQEPALRHQRVHQLMALHRAKRVIAPAGHKCRAMEGTQRVLLIRPGAKRAGLAHEHLGAQRLGHRHTDVVVIDFVGQAKFYTSLLLPTDDDATNHSKLVATVRSALAALPNKQEGRLAGIGIAMPEDAEELALGPTGMGERFETIGKEIEEALGIEVYVQNDITAAAAGESMFGAAKSLDDYLFFYIGARLHHRLVLNHQIFQSRAQASQPIGLVELENRLQAARLPTDCLWDRDTDWPDMGDEKTQWLNDCVEVLKTSLDAASQFLPVSTVIVSCYAPELVCNEIVAALKAANTDIEAKAGALQPSPKALGAASLPFSSKFTVET